jgi:AraC-like DNA-binding protein
MEKCDLSTIASQHVHRGWQDLLRQAVSVYGLDPQLYFPKLVDDKKPSSHLDIAALRQINYQLLQDSKDPLFTLKASYSVSALTFDSYSLTLWTAPTLYDLLKDACDFNTVLGSPTRMTYQQKVNGDVELCFINSVAFSKCSPDRQPGISLYIATIIQIIQKTSYNDIPDLEVNLTNTPYNQQLKDKFASEMGCKVTLGAPLHTLCIKQTHLNNKLKSSDAEIYLYSRALLRKQVAKVETENTVLKVYSVLDKLPKLTNISSESIAAEMLISVRTLNRRLAEVGLSYRSVIENYKLEKAVQLLNHPNINITEVAFQLGFSDLSAFSRAFKRWTGTSPSHFG